MGETKTTPDVWPKSGPDFNRWNDDVALFAALLKIHPHLWLCNSKLKYLDIRIDTRTGHFTVRDRDGDEIEPEKVLFACIEARDRFGDGCDGAPDHA